MSLWPLTLFSLGALGEPEDTIEAADELRPVVAEAVESTGAIRLSKHAGSELRIDPQAEIFEICERPIAAYGDDVVYGGLADAFEGGERIIDGVVAGFEVAWEVCTDGAHLDAEAIAS